MARQSCAFVVGVRFGLKKDGFAWECPQKVKKTSSDILVGFILTVNLQYSVNVAPNRGLLRFQLSSLCWFCGQKCDVKTYILRTRCPQGQFKVSLCDTFNVLGFLGTYLAAVMRLSVFVCLFVCFVLVFVRAALSSLSLQYLVNMAPSRGFLRFQSFET